MKLNIAVLPGDGIGPEIVEQGMKAVKAVCEKYGHELSYKHALVGAVAIDETGNPYPDETHELCMQSDAVYFGAIGSPKYDNNPSAKVRPEQGLLGMRKKLGLFANIRPVTTFPSLLHKSPLRAELIEGADFMCIRELGGVVDKHIFCLHIRIFLFNLLCYLTPQTRSSQHIRLIDYRYFLAAFLCILVSQANDTFDLFTGINTGIVSRVPIFASTLRTTEIHTTRQFTDTHKVCSLDQFGTKRRFMQQLWNPNMCYLKETKITN